MLRKLWAGIALITVIAISAACGGGSNAELDSSSTSDSSTTDLSGLPSVPTTSASRSVNATGPYQFSADDIYDSALAAFTDTTLTLDENGFAYAILGVNSEGETPTVLDLSGTCSGMYIGISNYDSGCWYWLDDGPYNAAGEITLPTGEWCNNNNSFYIALVCPDGASAQIGLSATLEELADWSVMVYVAGDNSLASAAVDDLNEMETVGSSENINVLAAYDINSMYLGPNRPSGVSEPHFIKVVTDTSDNSINTTGDDANQTFSSSGYNSADPDNLLAFVEWATENFPAKHTMLVLWDHGNGWTLGSDGSRSTSGILCDDTDGDPEYLTDNSIIADTLADYHFDILGFDACNMGQIEATYDFYGLADYYVVSEVVEPNDGWNYTYFLQEWVDNYPLETEDLCDAIVTGYNQVYAGSEESTLAAISADDLATLVTALHDLAAEVTTKASTETDAFHSAVADAYEDYNGDGSRDLLGFLEAYSGYTSDSTIQALITTAENAFNDGVFAFAQSLLSDCNGLGIWLPSTDYFTSDYTTDYDTLAFDDATGWLALLNAVGGGGSGENEEEVPLMAWEPGYTVAVSFHDATLHINPLIDDPDGNYGTPEEPAGLSGTVAFSDDSTTSGVAEETAELLSGAPAGMYTLYLSGDSSEDADTASIQLLDASDNVVYDFGQFEIGGSSASEITIAYLFYDDGSFGTAAWEPGDYIQIEWTDSKVEFDVGVYSPNGGYGSPYNTYMQDDIMEYSDDNPSAGDTYEYGILLDTAPEGIYPVSVEYYGYYGFGTPTTVSANVRLYDADDSLKQDFGSVSFGGNDTDTLQFAAVLTYTAD